MFRLAVLLACIAAPAAAETALAAVAANFAGTAKALATAFLTDTGHDIQLTTGSTGKLYAQITQGAPFDLMLSADVATPARLSTLGHGVPFTYAMGALTLWAPSGAADPEALLTDPEIRHIAIANPALAPYGYAAKEYLINIGLWDKVQPKIVMGQNIGQTFSLVVSGAAEAGFVATSSLTPDTAGLTYSIPQALFTPIRQDAILLTHGAKNPAAIEFLSYLQSDVARAIITAHGYGLPQ